MDKKTVSVILMGLFVFGFLAFFSVSYIKHSSPFTLTGFTIYSSQPNATEGIDTYIRESSSTNYGTQADLRAGKTTGAIEFKSLLMFDVSSVPSTDTIVNATLQLYVSGSDGIDNRTIGVYRVTTNWTESDANWYNASSSEIWFSQGGDYAVDATDSLVIENTTGNYYNFTITDLVSDWVDGTYSNYGLILRAPSVDNGQYTSFASSDHGTVTFRPHLVIEHSANAKPTISADNQSTNSSVPLQPGENVTFTATWNDLEGANTRMFVCNSSNINISQCVDTEYCNTSTESTNPHSCSYTITTSENRSNTYYLAVCDAGNCSTVENGTFYMNHISNSSIIQPNGGESLNQTAQGNYPIQFRIQDADSDNLDIYLYYSETANGTTNLITSMNNSDCNDPDSDTSTSPNNCVYSWNTTGIYGTYYLTIVLSDSYHNSTSTSSSTFNISSIIDSDAPSITSPSIDSTIYSGKTTTINATISDNNTITAWIDLNYTSTNVTMYNTSTTAFTGNFTAPAVGTYTYKVYARDPVGNLNDSITATEFTVSKPSATLQNENAPSTALPYHAIKITGEIVATESLTNITAYLNIPSGFTFLNDYPQQTTIGDISTGSTDNATWFLSTPITEGTYTLNITYTDTYSNQWNSSNMNVSVTSSVGGGGESDYDLSMAGYPEVETSDDYFTQAYFTENGSYTNPDSMMVSIYDAAGSLTVGPAAMTQESTGIYNYTYSVGASVTEGQWETIINATKSSTSYFVHEFWKVVGGPFDVRDITIIDGEVSDLNISFVAENTGGANKDLIMTWNLSREDTGAALDSGSETFMVPASSERTWYINPSTTYVGQVRITVLGYYSDTEKAGAYKVFSTTSATGVSCGDGTCNGTETCSTCSADCGACSSSSSSSGSGGGGGGGGGAPAVSIDQYKMSLKNFDKKIYMTKNIEQTIPLTIENTGSKELTDISLTIEGLDESYYTITPSKINSLKPGKTAEFEVKLTISDFIGEKDASYKLKSKETTLTEPITIVVLSMRDFFLGEIQELNNRINDLKNKITDYEDLAKDLTKCEDLVKGLSEDVEKEDFINVQNNLQEAKDCVSDVEKEFGDKTKVSIFEKMGGSFLIIVIVILLIVLIAALVAVIYLLNRKVGLIEFIRERRAQRTRGVDKTREAKDKFIKDKLTDLKGKVGSSDEEIETG